MSKKKKKKVKWTQSLGKVENWTDPSALEMFKNEAIKHFEQTKNNQPNRTV